MPMSDLSKEEAVEIARKSFAEPPLADTPSPVIRREGGKTVVYMSTPTTQQAAARQFVEFWTGKGYEKGQTRMLIS